ncbi:MAG: hypothetical protein ACLRYE_10020 [Gemmiger formicilis]|uniref:hypothetical protein n=1 Tax=Gemmiger formicilis TaxID=745368 RepID=UPI0039A2B919
MKISYDPRVGWSITEPTDALCNSFWEQDWQDISMNRIEDFYAPCGKGAGDATGKPTGSNPNSHSIKYVCPAVTTACEGQRLCAIKCADTEHDDDRTIKRNRE